MLQSFNYKTVSLQELADIMTDVSGKITTINGGDHLINIWNDGASKMIAIQGTGESATIIRL